MIGLGVLQFEKIPQRGGCLPITLHDINITTGDGNIDQFVNFKVMLPDFSTIKLFSSLPPILYSTLWKLINSAYIQREK